MLCVLQALWAEQDSGSSTKSGQTVTQQILQIMELILLEASHQEPDKYSVSVLRSLQILLIFLVTPRISKLVVCTCTCNQLGVQCPDCVTVFQELANWVFQEIFKEKCNVCNFS
jgi:hypothetical protein